MERFREIWLKLAESSIASLNPYRLCSASLRMLPDFLIIGTQRGGTSSLFNCLAHHPQVRASSVKEVHYFSVNYNKGPLWYRSHFPLSLKNEGDLRIVTGEATPYYLFHPRVPGRVHGLLPNAKLIVLLRNPVDRAISHYHHMVSLGGEVLSLEEAIAQEPLRLAGEADRIRDDPYYNSVNHRRYSYVSRGLYHEQILGWTRHFPRERLLILNSEEFFRNQLAAVRSAYEFLGLDSFRGARLQRDNSGDYPKIPRAVRNRIHDLFEAPNSLLFDYLGVDYGWKP